MFNQFFSFSTRIHQFTDALCSEERLVVGHWPYASISLLSTYPFSKFTEVLYCFRFYAKLNGVGNIHIGLNYWLCTIMNWWGATKRERETEMEKGRDGEGWSKIADEMRGEECSRKIRFFLFSSLFDCGLAWLFIPSWMIDGVRNVLANRLAMKIAFLIILTTLLYYYFVSPVYLIFLAWKQLFSVAKIV